MSSKDGGMLPEWANINRSLRGCLRIENSDCLQITGWLDMAENFQDKNFPGAQETCESHIITQEVCRNALIFQGGHYYFIIYYLAHKLKDSSPRSWSNSYLITLCGPLSSLLHDPHLQMQEKRTRTTHAVKLVMLPTHALLEAALSRLLWPPESLFNAFPFPGPSGMLIRITKQTNQKFGYDSLILLCSRVVELFFFWLSDSFTIIFVSLPISLIYTLTTYGIHLPPVRNHYSNQSTQTQQTSKKDEHMEKYRRETCIFREKTYYLIPYSHLLF